MSTSIYQNKERDGQGFSGGTKREVDDRGLNMRFVLSHGSTNSWRGGAYDKLTWIHTVSHNLYAGNLPTLVLEGHVNPEDLLCFYFEKLALYATPKELLAAFKTVHAAGFETGRARVQADVRAALGL